MLSVLLPALLRLGLLAIVGIVVGLVFGVVPALAVVIAGLLMQLAIHMNYATRLADWLELRCSTGSRTAGACGPTSLRDCTASGARPRSTSDGLLENEERFRRTISALPEGIVLVDASLQIDWCNPVAEQHLGVRLSADQGLRVTNLVRDPEFVAYLTSAHFESPLVFRPLARPGRRTRGPGRRLRAGAFDHHHARHHAARAGRCGAPRLHRQCLARTAHAADGSHRLSRDAAATRSRRTPRPASITSA